MTEVDEETREQFQRIDGQFQWIDGQFQRIDGQFSRLIHVMTENFEAIGAQFDEMRKDAARTRDEMLRNFDALYKRDGDRQIEYQVIKAALSRVEATVRDVQSSVNRLEAADLENRVARLEEAVHRDHDA